MHALQLKLLVAFAVVVALAVGHAASAVPVQAGPAPVSVSVTVRHSVALCVAATTAGVARSRVTVTSNVDCYAEPTTIERDGTPVTVLTVVPSR